MYQCDKRPKALDKTGQTCHDKSINQGRDPMINLNTLGSDCARKVSVNPITGTAKVTFANGSGPYRFTRVSRRALTKAALTELVGGQRSVGGWIWRNLFA